MTLERLAESAEFATEILEVLRRCGWDVTLTKALGNVDYCSARKGDHDFWQVGDTPLQAAYNVFKACAQVEQLKPVEGQLALDLGSRYRRIPIVEH